MIGFKMNNLPENLRKFINNVIWIYAKTYAETCPHKYIVREKVDENLFLELAKHIRENGYIGQLYNNEYVYFDYQDMVYWTMGAPINETTIINRCTRENTYAYRLAHDNLPN